MKHNTIKKKKIRRDCWDLDSAFFKWLKERLPVYLKEAGEVVDLEYHKFEFRGKEYTQKEVAEMLNISQSYISRIEKKVVKKLQTVFSIYTSDFIGCVISKNP